LYDLHNEVQTQSMWENLYVVVTLFVTKKKLQDLTQYMICFWIPCHKLYKEGVFSYVLTLKYTCHFGMSSKKLGHKDKT